MALVSGCCLPSAGLLKSFGFPSLGLAVVQCSPSSATSMTSCVDAEMLMMATVSECPLRRA